MDPFSYDKLAASFDADDYVLGFRLSAFGSQGLKPPIYFYNP